MLAIGPNRPPLLVINIDTNYSSSLKPLSNRHVEISTEQDHILPYERDDISKFVSQLNMFPLKLHTFPMPQLHIKSR
jgi:hypothetical protein